MLIAGTTLVVVVSCTLASEEAPSALLTVTEKLNVPAVSVFAARVIDDSARDGIKLLQDVPKVGAMVEHAQA